MHAHTYHTEALTDDKVQTRTKCCMEWSFDCGDLSAMLLLLATWLHHTSFAHFKTPFCSLFYISGLMSLCQCAQLATFTNRWQLNASQKAPNDIWQPENSTPHWCQFRVLHFVVVSVCFVQYCLMRAIRLFCQVSNTQWDTLQSTCHDCSKLHWTHYNPFPCGNKLAGQRVDYKPIDNQIFWDRHRWPSIRYSKAITFDS